MRHLALVILKQVDSLKWKECMYIDINVNKTIKISTWPRITHIYKPKTSYSINVSFT